MVFTYKGRAKAITLTVQDGDKLDLSHYRAVRVLERNKDFTSEEPKKVAKKKPKAED